MKLTPTACCTIRASRGPGAAVSSSVHCIASGPPAACTTTPMSAMSHLNRFFQRPYEPADAFAGAAQQALVGSKAYPNEVSRPFAECTAVDHRHAFGPIELRHEFIAREPGAPHIEQHEHARIGDAAAYLRYPAEAREQHIAALGAKVADPGFGRRRDAQCRQGRFLNESRQPVQHANRQ